MEHVQKINDFAESAYRIYFGKRNGGGASGGTDTQPFHFPHKKKWVGRGKKIPLCI